MVSDWLSINYFVRFREIVHLHFAFLGIYQMVFYKMTCSNSYIHTLMAVAAMQGADQHIRSSLGFSILPKDTLTCRPGELNQQPSNNKMLVPPLRHSCDLVVRFKAKTTTRLSLGAKKLLGSGNVCEVSTHIYSGKLLLKTKLTWTETCTHIKLHCTLKKQIALDSGYTLDANSWFWKLSPAKKRY